MSSNSPLGEMAKQESYQRKYYFTNSFMRHAYKYNYAVDADTSAILEGAEALRNAVEAGHPEVLLQEGYDPDTFSKANETHLHTASMVQWKLVFYQYVAISVCINRYLNHGYSNR